MTNELRDRLDGARNRAPAPRFDLDALETLRDRRATRHRVEALVVGLGILVVLVAGAFAWQRPDGSLARSGGDLGPLRGWSAPHQLAFPTHGYRYERRIAVRIETAQNGEPASVIGVSDANMIGASWYALDDSGRIREQGAGIGGAGRTYAAGDFPNDTGDLSGLSTDPATLLDQLVQRTGPDGASPEPYDDFTTGPESPLTAGLVRAAGELLNDTNSTPALRATLALVLAGLDGASVQRGHDPFGREAVDVSIQSEREIHHWWFDPQTLQLLVLADGEPEGSTYFVLVVEASGYVDDTDGTHPQPALIPELAVDTNTPVSLAP
jgi:hypothetical protein